MIKIFYTLIIFFSVLLIGFLNISESYAQVASIPDDPYKDRLNPSEFRNILATIIIGIGALIIFFITWLIVKKIFHKRNPKIIGGLAVIIFIIVLLFVFWSRPL